MESNSFSNFSGTGSRGSEAFDLNKAIEEAAKKFPNETSEYLKKKLGDNSSKNDSK